MTDILGADLELEIGNERVVLVPTNEPPVTSVNGKQGAVVLDAEDVGAYELPDGGIPKSDLSESVQASLDLADSALQEHQSLAGYVTEGELEDAATDILSNVAGDLAGKVDKVSGKGLSTNDFTNAEAAKLAGIEPGAQVNKIETVNGIAPVSGKDVFIKTKDTYPTLTETQKQKIHDLIATYLNDSVRQRFIYNDDKNSRNSFADRATVINNAQHEPGKQIYRLNCSNFVQLIMMGRKATDFPVDDLDYNNHIDKAFDFGYYLQFPFRRIAAGLHKTDPVTGVEDYYGFNAPHKTDQNNDYTESYSWNSYYTGATDAKYGQTFRGYMTSADIAFELHSLGCEIPLSEVDVGDIVFFKAQGDEDSDNENFRRNKISWRSIIHCAVVYQMQSWPKAQDADPVVDRTSRRLPTFAECVGGEKPIQSVGIYSIYNSDRVRQASLMYNAVMAARLPIAWGIPSNVPDSITAFPAIEPIPLQQEVT